jgi:hypothetical protein
VRAANSVRGIKRPVGSRDEVARLQVRHGSARWIEVPEEAAAALRRAHAWPRGGSRFRSAALSSPPVVVMKAPEYSYRVTRVPTASNIDANPPSVRRVLASKRPKTQPRR